ncbi:dynamin family protein [Vibrio breoganii]
MDYKKQYDEKKAGVLTLLETTRQFYQNTDDVENEHAFEELYRQVENGEFSIVVVGEFSAGKSTFLNAMMGDKYLPSFSGETTATVNFLKHGGKAEPDERLRVIYNDGTTQSFAEASFDNVEKFATTKGEEVASSIQQVDLFLDSDFLQNDVILVDSPGLNGVREGHRKITEEQIKKSHACIFLFTAEQPGKNSDFEFLERLKGEVGTILLVLNKIDTINLNEESIESVLKILTKNYLSKFPHAQSVPEIWPISAQDALVARSDKEIVQRDYNAQQKQALIEKSRLLEFEERLWRFLTQGEKARSELLEPVNRVIKLLKNTRKANNQLISELQESHSKGEVLAQISALEEQLEKIGQTVENNKRTIKRQVRQSRIAAENTMTGTLESIRERYMDKFDNDFIKDHDRLLMDDDADTSLKRFISRLEDDVNNSLASFALSFQAELEGTIQSIADIELEGINEELSKLSQPVELRKSAEIGQYTLSLDYAEVEKRRTDLEDEIEKLEQRLNSSELEEKSAIRLMHKKESLEERKRTLMDQKHSELAAMGPAPTVERVESEYIDRESRDGVVGKGWSWMFGNKIVRKTKITIDDSRIKNFQQHRQSVEQRYDSDIAEVTAELSGIDDQDIEVSHLACKEINNKLKRMEDQKRSLTEDFNATQRRHFKTQLKKIQEDIEERIDSIRSEALSEISSRLRSHEKSLIPLLSHSLESNLSDKLLRKKQELELKKIDLEGSISEKEQLIEKCERKNEQISEILTAAIGVQCDMEEQAVDIIEQRNISEVIVGA